MLLVANLDYLFKNRFQLVGINIFSLGHWLYLLGFQDEVFEYLVFRGLWVILQVISHVLKQVLIFRRLVNGSIQILLFGGDRLMLAGDERAESAREGNEFHVLCDWYLML